MSRSTGRVPSVNLETLRTLLTRWFDDDKPSIQELSSEAGMCLATTRKYLRLGLARPLPRGRAASLTRGEANIQKLMNSVPTDALLGAGRMELLHRRRAARVGLDAIAAEFGISRRRVKAVLTETNES